MQFLCGYALCTVHLRHTIVCFVCQFVHHQWSISIISELEALKIRYSSY